MAMTESDIRSPGVPDRPPGRGRTGSAARAASALLAVLLAVTALVACSSKSSGTASSAASTSAAASPSASASGSAPADVAAAEAQVKQNWEKFFDPAIPLADKAALLQNGDQLAPALQGFAQDPRVGQVKAQVTGVTFNSPTDATVTYSLSLQGTVVEPSATGQAVLDNGTWKVSRSSLCGLVAQSGNTAVPGCS